MTEFKPGDTVVVNESPTDLFYCTPVGTIGCVKSKYNDSLWDIDIPGELYSQLHNSSALTPVKKPIPIDPVPAPAEHDPVNRPAHYTSSPSGIECIDVVEHMNFNRGNAIKYLFRAGHKGNELEDVRKAAWYCNREVAPLR